MSRSTPGVTRAPVNEWVTEFLRFTLFHEATDVRATESFWNEVVGTPLDDIIQKPQLKEYAVVGKWQDKLLNIQSQAGRMDWYFASAGNPEQAPLRYIETAETFTNLIARWQAGIPAISRFAFGGIVSLESPDANTAYRTISNYMNFDLDRGECSDFLFQINRKKPSRVINDAYINRLTKWNVVHSGKMIFTVSEGKMVALQVPESAGFTCRLELDLNTSPDYSGGIPAASIVDLAKEMDSMSREIIAHGDI